MEVGREYALQGQQKHMNEIFCPYRAQSNNDFKTQGIALGYKQVAP